MDLQRAYLDVGQPWKTNYVSFGLETPCNGCAKTRTNMDLTHARGLGALEDPRPPHPSPDRKTRDTEWPAHLLWAPNFARAIPAPELVSCVVAVRSFPCF